MWRSSTMAKAPTFRFFPDAFRDVVHLVVRSPGLQQAYELDGMRFDVNPAATLPEVHSEHLSAYLDAVQSFKAARDAQGSAESAQGAHPHA